MHSLTHFCNHQPRYLGEYIKFKNYTIDRNILPYLKQVAPSVFETDDRCELAAEQRFNCDQLFSEILTDAGLCYTFNQMSSKDVYKVQKLADDFPTVDNFQVSYWHLVDFSMNDSQELRNISYPYKMRNAGTGFEMWVKIPKMENDFLCSDLLEGFKIQIHSANEVPRLKKFFYHIPFDHDVRIAARPEIMVTSSSLIDNYGPKQRKCIADNEHSLRFFKKYTQSNCHLDTLVYDTNRICGCVLFWMPRFNETKVCSVWAEFQCVERVENSIHNANLTGKCLPECNSITYEAEISISKIEVKALGNFVPDGYKIIKIAVLFKNQQYYNLYRSELYGTMDFIAACGGILSLFMGISLLSVIEIIYFATLRLTCNLHKRNMAKKRMLAQQKMMNNQD